MRTLLVTRSRATPLARRLPVRCRRERTGEGQHLDLSMIDSGLFSFSTAFRTTLLSEDHERGSMLIDILYDLGLQRRQRDYLVGSYDICSASLPPSTCNNLLEDPRFDTFENQMRNIRELKATVALTLRVTDPC